MSDSRGVEQYEHLKKEKYIQAHAFWSLCMCYSERSRASRAALLEGEDDADNFIGVEGEAFKILEHAPQPVVSFCLHPE